MSTTATVLTPRSELGQVTTPTTVQFTPRQLELQSDLVRALRDAIPVEEELERVRQRSHGCYRIVGEILADLRHEFPGTGNEPCDLRGRSYPYRLAVREAYAKVGADTSVPVPKRLTVGVAYWVRKILIERYGEQKLYEFGVLRGPVGIAYRLGGRLSDDLPEDPLLCLNAIVGILNSLAVDPSLVPTEEVVRAAVRAVLLLRDRLDRDAEVP